jgi:hypothetical protein
MKSLLKRYEQAGGRSQAVEHLPRKREALSSKPDTAKKKSFQ